MNGHARKRGARWEVILDLGDQEARRCPACREASRLKRARLYWAEDGPPDRCPKCGGDLEDVVARRQELLRDRYPTKKVAEKALRDAITERERGDYVPPVDLTVGQYLKDRWVPALDAENLSANTVQAYRLHVEQRIVPRIGAIRLQALTRSDVSGLAARLATEKGPRKRVLSPSTRRSVLIVLHRALGDAVRDGLIRSNPAAGIKLPRVRPAEMHTWTAADLSKFLAATEADRLGPLWRLLSQTGLRRGEALGLKWSDVDLEAGVLSIQRQRKQVGYEVVETTTKTASGRAVPLDLNTVASLKRQSQQQLDDAAAWDAEYVGDGHVFTRENGAPWQPDRITKLFDQAVAAVGVPRIRLHDLRHTWASIALGAGIHPKVVQERLGHSSIAITMDRYSHCLPSMQESAAQLVANLVDTAGES